MQTSPAEGSLTAGLLCWFLGCVVVYSVLFGTGYFLHGKTLIGFFCIFLPAVRTAEIFRTLPRVRFD